MCKYLGNANNDGTNNVNDLDNAGDFMELLIESHESATNAYFRLDFDESKVKLWTKDGTTERNDTYIQVGGDRIMSEYEYSYSQLFSLGATTNLYIQAMKSGYQSVNIIYLLDGQELGTEWVDCNFLTPEFVSLTFPHENPVQYHTFRLYTESNNIPEITWTGLVNVPKIAESKTLRYVQNINTMRKCVFKDGSSAMLTTSNQWYLDTCNPYLEGGDERIAFCPQNYEQYELEGEDSPAQPVGREASEDIDEFIIEDYFKLYLQYVNSNGDAHTLAVAEWQWKARLQRDSLRLFLELDVEFSEISKISDGAACSDSPALSPIAYGINNSLNVIIDDNNRLSPIARQYAEDIFNFPTE